MIFGSDNMLGASQQVLDAIVRANVGLAASYGADDWCAQATARIADVFECPVEVFYVSTGTVANSLALSALVPPWGSVLCHHQAHIVNDESSAPELFSGGARLSPIVDASGKLGPAALAQALATAPHPPHNVVPRALSLTQATECGLVYTPAEVSALAKLAHDNDLYVHMDGARFANAVASLGCSPAESTWRAGVDVLCLGASKNGALMAEAIVFFDPALAEDFAFRVKRAGQMAAKGRLFGAQFCGWLDNDHWLDLARHANGKARELSAALAAVPGVEVVWPVDANEVFVTMPTALATRLRAAGGVFYDWHPSALPAGRVLGADDSFVRLVCGFGTESAQIDALLQAAA
jgi:threonine aldolase